MHTLELRTLPIDSLQPAPYNPRKVLAVTSPAYRKLKASLQEFGLVEPLIWNELTGYVVGGHARLRILQELGVSEVPVSVVRLSEARERALNVVLNNQEAQGRYDTRLLAELLEEIRELPEFAHTGFDPGVLATLRYEPPALDPIENSPSDSVEITIVIPSAIYPQIEPHLDTLIREYQLEIHSRTL